MDYSVTTYGDLNLLPRRQILSSQSEKSISSAAISPLWLVYGPWQDDCALRARVRPVLIHGNKFCLVLAKTIQRLEDRDERKKQ